MAKKLFLAFTFSRVNMRLTGEDRQRLLILNPSFFLINGVSEDNLLNFFEFHVFQMCQRLECGMLVTKS